MEDDLVYGRILACWDQSLHHQLIYILVCTCIDFSHFIASQYFYRAHICMHAKFRVFFPIWLRSKSISHLQYTHKHENINLGYYSPRPDIYHSIEWSLNTRLSLHNGPRPGGPILLEERLSMLLRKINTPISDWLIIIQDSHFIMMRQWSGSVFA